MRTGFPERRCRLRKIPSAHSAAGYIASLPRRLSLVQRDTQGVKGADDIHLIGFGQYEHSDGHEYGGDDFIAKPFDQSVLMAKIQALLRRIYDFGGAAPALEHRGAVLNTGSQTLLYGGETVHLTKNEYRILLALMENRGRVVSREKLMQKLWETDSFVGENTLTVNINRLRKKLDAAGLENFISTRFGVGYIME